MNSTESATEGERAATVGPAVAGNIVTRHQQRLLSGGFLIESGRNLHEVEIDRDAFFAVEHDMQLAGIGLGGREGEAIGAAVGFQGRKPERADLGVAKTRAEPARSERRPSATPGRWQSAQATMRQQIERIRFIACDTFPLVGQVQPGVVLDPAGAPAYPRCSIRASDAPKGSRRSSPMHHGNPWFSGTVPRGGEQHAHS